MSIGVILSSGWRFKNIPHLLHSIGKQSLKADRVILWLDQAEGLDLDSFRGFEVIATNTRRWQNFPQFISAYLLDTDYIAVIDDDTPPGPHWFEFAVDYINGKKYVIGGYGMLFRSRRYRERSSFKSFQLPAGTSLTVDAIGQTYFMPKALLLPFFREFPPFWENIVDLHFSYMLWKYKRIRPRVVNPDDPLASPYHRVEELPISPFELSMSRNAKRHLDLRDSYIKWARDWRFLYEEEGLDSGA
jgi:glycosyltransferase involved in cell wall biosynthesis